MKYLVSAFALCVGLVTGAQSATINVYASTGASVNPTIVPGGGSDPDSDFEIEDSQFTPSTSVNAASSIGPVSTSASGFADSETGVLRAEVTAAGIRGDGLGNGSATASAGLFETYSVEGTGTITVSMAVDGLWDLSRINLQPGQPDPLPFWQVQADIQIGSSSRDFVCLGTSCSPSSNQSNSGAIDTLLQVSAPISTVFGPQDVTIYSSLLAQILTGNGFIDFGNTAELFVEFSDGLTATPQDPDFLINPAFSASGSGGGGTTPAPVPLPAAGWMLLAGLAGLRALRAKKT